VSGVDAISEWHELLGPPAHIDPRLCLELDAAMRARKLTFGDRVHCPFLRPFFLSESDEGRIRTAAETLAALGERVAREALTSPSLLTQLGVTEAEQALIRLDPGYTTASTASRLDAFLLPSSLHFAEYNAESPAGPAYAQRLCELFDALPVMTQFRESHRLRFHRLIPPLLDALIASYREWGGTARPPNVAIVDWREVPTWSEFELLRDAFEASGVPTIVADPRDLVFDGTSLTTQGRRIDLVYRRVLINDIVARPDECKALVDAYAARAVCVANTFRCKLAHKKAFFAVLTDPRNAALFTDAERQVIARHVPWTRLMSEDVADKARRDRERLVLKPNDEYGGKGVVLGWETVDAVWEGAITNAFADPPGTWIVQERIPVRREVFPQFDSEGRVTMREMLVDFAPYIFRGRIAGYLTRLSATGLANVTSGGGQVPAFVVG
jgi:Circularly permuted ATP-grasp type 2